MSAPLTPDDLERMREYHQPKYLASCRCEAAWPCDARRLLDEVERLQSLAYKRVGQMMANAGQSEAPSVSEGGRD